MVSLGLGSSGPAVSGFGLGGLEEAWRFSAVRSASLREPPLCPLGGEAETPLEEMERTSSFRNASAAVKREVPTWVSPIDAQRKSEITACAQEVITSLWPALKDAYMHEVLESCVRRYDGAKEAASTPYVCAQSAPIHAQPDPKSKRKGKLRPGERVEVMGETVDGYLRFTGGWVQADRMEQQRPETSAAAEPAPEPEQAAGVFGGPMVAAPAVGAMGLDLQTPSNAPVGGFDLMGGGAMAAAPAMLGGGGGFDLIGGGTAPAPAPPMDLTGGGGFDLMGGSPAPAPPVVGGGLDLMGGGFAAAAPNLMGGGGGFDLMGGGAMAPAPAAVGFDLMGGGFAAAPPVAAGDPFASMMSPQTPAPDPFASIMGGGAAVPAPAPAVGGEADLLGFGRPAAPAPAPAGDLPPGWIKKESKQYAGKFFYYHTATNTTTWEKPSSAPAAAPAAGASPKNSKKGRGGMMGKAKAAMEQAAIAASTVGVAPETKPTAAASAAAPLPPGWEKKESGQYPGKFFYYNAASKQTTWERPAGAAAAPAADLLGMFGAAPAPAAAPAAAPQAGLLGLPPQVAAPQPGGGATAAPQRSPSSSVSPSSRLAGAASASSAGAASVGSYGVIVLPTRASGVKKETGDRVHQNR